MNKFTLTYVCDATTVLIGCKLPIQLHKASRPLAVRLSSLCWLIKGFNYAAACVTQQWQWFPASDSYRLAAS